MIRYADDAEPGVCPFINQGDSRCARRFKLSRMDQAFKVCMTEQHTQCMTYLQLAGQREHEQISITIAGRPIPQPSYQPAASYPYRGDRVVAVRA